MVDADPVLLEAQGGVAVISLDRAGQHNVVGDAADSLFEIGGSALALDMALTGRRRRYRASMSYKPESSDVPLHESSGGPDIRLIVRLVVAAVAIVLAILFVVQNNDRVETSFVFFDVTTRLWVGLIVALILGALLGQAVEALWERRKRRKVS